MNRPLRLCLCLLGCWIFTAQLAQAEHEWPQWRGPEGQGHAVTATNLPTVWSETKNVAWKTPIIGQGHSSPVISGEEIWLTTAVDQPADDADKAERLKVNTGNQPLNIAAKVTFYALCINRDTGKIEKNVKLWTVDKPQWVHQLNTYASPSPILRDGNLYCHFGSFGTGCVNTKSGKVVWMNRELEVMHENGPGSTPALWKNRLILTFDGSDKQFVAALDTETGELAWKTFRSGKLNSNPQLQKSYCTPAFIKVAGKTQVVSPGADWIYAYDPADGKELWRVAYGQLGFSLVPRPVVGHGMIYMSTCFGKTRVLAIRYEKNGKPVTPHIAWHTNRQAPKMPSPLLVGDELYYLADNGIITCVDAHSGEEVWKSRLGDNFCSSPVFADGKIFVFSREGECTVIKPGRTFQEIATNQLDGGFYASAAAINNTLYLRTDKALYRIEAN